MKIKRKKAAPKRRAKFKTPPRKMRTNDLCKSLTAIAAFHVEDPLAQTKIYEACRRLQLLDKIATDIGILPS